MGWNDDSAFDGLYESIPAWIGFMESHDEERAAYKQTQWGDEALKTDLTTRMRQLEVNASFFFTVPGPKMIGSSERWDTMFPSKRTAGQERNRYTGNIREQRPQGFTR